MGTVARSATGAGVQPRSNLCKQPEQYTLSNMIHLILFVRRRKAYYVFRGAVAQQDPLAASNVV